MIEYHNLPVCGSLGSECPVIVQIDYVDGEGGDREWQEGFYSVVNPPGIENPDVCWHCSETFRRTHIPGNTWYAYLSGNLILLLSRNGLPPQTIKEIAIYASGHEFDALVTDVELLVGS